MQIKQFNINKFVKSSWVLPLALTIGVVLCPQQQGFAAQSVQVKVTPPAALAPKTPAKPKPKPAAAKPVPADQQIEVQRFNPATPQKTSVPITKTQKPAVVSKPTQTVVTKQAGPVVESSSTKNMRLVAENPSTGKAYNIDITSNSLHFDPSTNMYHALGEVYLIAPERNLEILADKMTYDTMAQTLTAMGKVFIIYKGDVVAADQAFFDMEKDYAHYDQPKTVSEFMRMRSQTSDRLNELTVIKEGRMIIDQEMMGIITQKLTRRRLAFGNGAQYNTYSARWARKYVINSGTSELSDVAFMPAEQDDLQQSSTENNDILVDVENKTISPADVAAANFDDDNNKFKIHVKEAKITKEKEGFDRIELKGLKLKYGKMPIGYARKLDLGYAEDTNYVAYLGDEFGYDIDLGGYYYGPAYDKQVGNGWLKFIPFLSYGNGRRPSGDINDPKLVSAQAGIGAELAYMSRNTMVRGGYNTTLGAPRFFFEQRLFKGNHTRIRAAYNRVVNNGFYGSDRPHWIAEVRDLRRKTFWDNRLRLDTYASFGFAEDEFFPTGQATFFVSPKSASPITTFRAQFQANLRTGRPIIQVKDYLSIGATSRLRAGYYGTGDHMLVLQAGPYANLTLGPLFTQATLLSGINSGSSPFVFDDYYGGNTNLRLTNAIDITKNLSVGISHNMNLSKDNARGDLIVGQQIFFSAGPEAMKFSFAYDIVQKRSFFGVTLNPDGGNLIVDFNRINYFDPGYEGPANMTMQQDVVAPQY